MHTHQNSQPDPGTDDQRRRIAKVIRKRHFCTLATTSETGRSHAAGVIYQAVDGELWFHTNRTSRKARSIATSGHVGVCIPFRRLPAGPPFTIHFQATAEIVAMDDPAARQLVASGRLKKITGHGELDHPEGCFVSVRPATTVHSYGPGVPVIDLIRDPINTGARTVRLDPIVGAAR